MTPETDEDKLTRIYEFCIRMEPVIKDVTDLKKWRDGNDFLPGARAQLWVLWIVFLAVLGKVWGNG